MKILKSIRSFIIRCHSLKRLSSNNITTDRGIYLTFDDGPEPNITEFVLEELRKYNGKATFFCVGNNIKKYPNLFAQIIKEGHQIGNHTYSHIHAHHTEDVQYLYDIEKFNMLNKTKLFRPPWGALTFKLYKFLKNKFYIVLWDVSSDDYLLNKFNLNSSLKQLINNTKPGSIILFHFCKRHENETRQILPLYLKYLYENNYKMLSL